AGQHADTVLAHLARGVTENLVAVLETDAEHRIGQQLHHLPAHLEQFFLGQKIPFQCKKSRSLSWRPAKCEGAALDRQNRRAAGLAAFQGTMRLGGITERETLLNLNLHLAAGDY